MGLGEAGAHLPPLRSAGLLYLSPKRASAKWGGMLPLSVPVYVWE